MLVKNHTNKMTNIHATLSKQRSPSTTLLHFEHYATVMELLYSMSMCLTGSIPVWLATNIFILDLQKIATSMKKLNSKFQKVSHMGSKSLTFTCTCTSTLRWLNSLGMGKKKSNLHILSFPHSTTIKHCIVETC